MLTPENQPIEEPDVKQPNKSKNILRNLLIFLGFAIAASLISINTLHMFDTKGESAPTNHVQSVLSNDDLKPYASHDNHFTILMPGIPDIKETHEKIDDHTIKVTTYQKSIGNGSKDYIVMVHDLTGTDLAQKDILNQLLNRLMQTYPNSQIARSSITDGNLDANFNISKNDRLYESNAKYILRNNKVYSIILIGGDQQKFNEFANSLIFN